MRDFFKGRNFKILLAFFIVVLVFTMRAAYEGSMSSIASRALSTVTAPVQRIVSAASESISYGLKVTFSGPRLARENTALRDENAKLREQLVDLDRYKAENNQLREYLNITTASPDLKLVPSSVIGRDTADRFSSFTIDKGTNDGVMAGDTVITAEGMVGVVDEATATTAKVLTLLDASVSVGAMDTKTRETGVTSGTAELYQQGLLRLSYLPRESEAKEGDIIVTTGIDGMFPKELVIGTVSEVLPDAGGLSLYAVIEPPTDLRLVTSVLVITDFVN